MERVKINGSTPPPWQRKTLRNRSGTTEFHHAAIPNRPTIPTYIPIGRKQIFSLAAATQHVGEFDREHQQQCLMARRRCDDRSPCEGLHNQRCDASVPGFEPVRHPRVCSFLDTKLRDSIKLIRSWLNHVLDGSSQGPVHRIWNIVRDQTVTVGLQPPSVVFRHVVEEFSKIHFDVLSGHIHWQRRQLRRRKRSNLG